jgi:hypothetical protein
VTARIALALLALGACVADDGAGPDAGDEQTSTTSAAIQNGTAWNPWTQTTQTWTRNIVRLPGCNGVLLDYEWVLVEAGCIPNGSDASDIEVEHVLADGTVETSHGIDLLVLSPDTFDVALLRLATPMHPGVGSLPIAGGTTDDLIGQTVFCASYGGTTTLRAASFQIIGNLYFPTTAYELDVPNAAGQIEVTADRGSPCWNGSALTGLLKATNNVDYNLHTSLPPARDSIRSLVTPPIIKEVNVPGTSCRPYTQHQHTYTDDGAILNPHETVHAYPIGCPITRPGTAGNGSDMISAAKVWVRDRNPTRGVCCHLLADNPSGTDVVGPTSCSSGVSTEPQQLTLSSIVAPAGHHASLVCSVPGTSADGSSGIEAYRVRLADRLAATAPPASSIKTTLPASGCAAASGSIDPRQNGEAGNFSPSTTLNLVCPVNRTTAPTLTTTVDVTVAVTDRNPNENACCQLYAQRPDAWPNVTSQQCTSGASDGTQTLYLPELTETDPLARFYVSCSVPRLYGTGETIEESFLQRLTIDQD